MESHPVHLIVTSPPYWRVKDYGNRNQIGFGQNYKDYINSLNRVWDNCIYNLLPGCKMCINIGDQFTKTKDFGKYFLVPIHCDIINYCAQSTYYLGSIIWQKLTNCNTSGGACIMGSYPYPRNGLVKYDYEYILIFKKPGKTKVSQEIKEQSKMTKEEWKEYFTGHWNIKGCRQKHIAIFPKEIPLRLIKMFSFVGETVLDPFLGSGTTMLAAKELGRDCIGYEINNNKEIIQNKVNCDIDFSYI